MDSGSGRIWEISDSWDVGHGSGRGWKIRRHICSFNRSKIEMILRSSNSWEEKAI